MLQILPQIVAGGCSFLSGQLLQVVLPVRAVPHTAFGKLPLRAAPAVPVVAQTIAEGNYPSVIFPVAPLLVSS